MQRRANFFLKVHAFFQDEKAAASVNTERFGTLTREQVALIVADLTCEKVRVGR